MLNNRDATQFDVHELDIATGELTLIAENPGGVYTWLSSDKGDLFATSLTPDGDLDPRAIVSPIVPAPLIRDRRTGELVRSAVFR